MNRADWARIPGARKSRYGVDPVGIAWIRLNVVPNTASQSAGWTVRVTSSVRSWRSFCSSTRHIAPTRRASSVTSPTGEKRSADAAGGAAGRTDIAHAPFLLGLREGVAGVVAEDVVERRV